ncbi:hypothetical protein EJB05_42141, partial [Eragrostis curvula]
MAIMVEMQGAGRSSTTSRATPTTPLTTCRAPTLVKAKEYQRSSRICLCIGIIVPLLLVLLVIVPIAASKSLAAWVRRRGRPRPALAARGFGTKGNDAGEEDEGDDVLAARGNGTEATMRGKRTEGTCWRRGERGCPVTATTYDAS